MLGLRGKVGCQVSVNVANHNAPNKAPPVQMPALGRSAAKLTHWGMLTENLVLCKHNIYYLLTLYTIHVYRVRLIR